MLVRVCFAATLLVLLSSFVGPAHAQGFASGASGATGAAAAREAGLARPRRTRGAAAAPAPEVAPPAACVRLGAASVRHRARPVAGLDTRALR